VKSVDIVYEFCKNKPAFIAKIELTNKSNKQEIFEFSSHLELSLKTCHTYRLKDIAITEIDESTASIYANHNDPETKKAQIFVSNAGESPERIAIKTNDIQMPNEIHNNGNPDRPVAAFVYKKNLHPLEKMTIIQLIGSSKLDEGRQNVEYLKKNYQREIESYEQYVLDQVFQQGKIETDNQVIDHSVHWAKAILATSRHYLDGEIVPMPCPAQYNFYFTHDVQLTDLAAVHFDLARVKNDLEYIIRHANEEKVIPHAYYWKDDKYVTEYADAENWNHFWFILLSASYLRHSGDIQTLMKLYPYIEKSITLTSSHKRDDDLLWAKRPDWWDIGQNMGPRAYVTILMIRSLHEYLYISTVLNKNLEHLIHYDNLATKMKQQLVDKLWDDNLKYLINYFEDGKKDEHFYIGSLLAAYFDLLDNDRKTALVQTATQNLLDEKIGIYNVFPMDFHLLGDYLKFRGNEAGEPFYYANGGIWPHGNAWYALALMAIGEKTQALQFIKNTMTVSGIMNSPNGQPAMYEYRVSKKCDPAVYGKIDKPQFMWAAGWYLYCLYNLYVTRENSWNICFDPFLAKNQQQFQANIFLDGKNVLLKISGSGRMIQSIKYDGNIYPSAVVPENISTIKIVDIKLGQPELPVLSKANSMLISAEIDKYKKTMHILLKAFRNHHNKIEIISPWKPISVNLNGTEHKENWSYEKTDEAYRINFNFIHQTNEDKVVIQF
jgi:glycogen debranching enzyme